ncbi:MAG: FAD-binding oxidoreductase [Deltaproteobacteria bacterium]
MSEITVRSLSGGESKIDAQAIDDLRAKLRGEVLLPGEGGYDEARSIWNAMIDRKPGIIVRCMGNRDVMDAVNFARENNILIAVKGAGHNIAGNAVCDGGLMIDLSAMNFVSVNPKTRRAYVGPGATLGDFDHETQAFGLATPVGINSTTGIAGLTLGGGFGWLTRKHGMTVDNLLSADVVTAEGKFLHASEEENPDLFWAIRGGGGNFGIVTMFEFELHPVGPEVLTGLIVFPFNEAKSVISKYLEYVEGLPEDLAIWVVLRQAPPLPFLPEEVHGKEVVVLAFMYAGKPEAGEKLIEPIRGFGNPHGEFVGVGPYEGWQKAFDPLLTPGARNYWKSHDFSDIGEGAVDTLIDYAGKLPSSQCEIFIAHLAGEANKIPHDATAYANRDTKFVLNVHGRWDDNSGDDKCISWAREFFDKSAEFATGSVYVNFMTEEETGRVTNAYGPNYDRMVQMKKKFDPKNLFRMNQNIKPSA